MKGFAAQYVKLRDQLARHLTDAEIRLLLYFDRAASFYGLPREWDIFSEDHLTNDLHVLPDAQRDILARLSMLGLIEVGELKGQRAIRVDGNRLQALLG